MIKKLRYGRHRGHTNMAGTMRALALLRRLDQEQAQAQAPQEPKRGRGRPRKVTASASGAAS